MLIRKVENQNRILILTILTTVQILGAVNSLKSLRIKVPTAVLIGGTAELICTYDLEGAQLYSIRWYRGVEEFYRFVPKESPATKVFPVASIKVDVSSSDEHRVILTGVEKGLTGEYQCEVSADAPLFHTGIKAAEMVVVEMPGNGPNISVDRFLYSGGDHIHANCSSAPSMPAANITWFVNEQQVPGFTANRVVDYSNGQSSSIATLELEASVLSPVPALAIRCEASLFDVWRDSSDTVRLREKSANPASALGRSLAGTAADERTSLLTVIFLSLLVKMAHREMDAITAR